MVITVKKTDGEIGNDASLSWRDKEHYMNERNKKKGGNDQRVFYVSRDSSGKGARRPPCGPDSIWSGATLPDFKPWRTRYESEDYGISSYLSI